MGTLCRDEEGWGGCSARDSGHPDPLAGWRVPRGCPRLVASQPASRQGLVDLGHPMGNGCAGALEQGGSQLPIQVLHSSPWGAAAVIWGVMEPPWRGRSGSEAGGRALRCCQGSDEQDRALVALPGSQCRQRGGSGDHAGLCRASSFDKASSTVMLAPSPFTEVYQWSLKALQGFFLNTTCLQVCECLI